MLKAKSIALGTPDTGWWYGRPILFPLISSIFFKLGLGEIGIRFIWLIMSVFNVGLIYFLGRELFNKRVGLIASALMSVSYIELFYSNRMLVNLPEVFFTLVAFILFVKVEFSNQNKKLIRWILPLLMIGTLMRFTVGLGIIILLSYLIITKGFNLFKEKEWYMSLLFAILLYLPYGLYSWIKYKNPVYVIASVLVGSTGDRAPGTTIFTVLKQYLLYLPQYTNWIFFLSFLLALFLLGISLVLSYDLIRKEEKSKKSIFIFLFLIIPLLYFGLFVNHFEDRYIAMILPIVFVLTAYGLDIVYKNIAKYSKNIIAMIILLVILISGTYFMYSHSDLIIKDKINSYGDLREVGLWIRSNSQEGDGILSAGVPQINYYSEREVYRNEQNITSQLELIKNKSIKYIIVTNWEKDPEWLYNYLSSNQTDFKNVYQSVSNYNNNQMFAVVFSTGY
jgi:4-amino-4-deoxy-L-arabinose transferase-like glycosyltransferase